MVPTVKNTYFPFIKQRSTNTDAAKCLYTERATRRERHLWETMDGRWQGLKKKVRGTSLSLEEKLENDRIVQTE
ncbi:hypothetical protein F443_13684 [Phytophthora nicotianae P1569]|uniref:Uncharacterized protein n=3 Tax=Phytophthora nicotianae TaxID=4792 RepID=V9ESJ3_PHYNI|nr:hypothetical protein F443_13684 [Phytophthora nicotianae P1569]